jgi:hypothetical protein
MHDVVVARLILFGGGVTGTLPRQGTPTGLVVPNPGVFPVDLGRSLIAEGKGRIC